MLFIVLRCQTGPMSGQCQAPCAVQQPHRKRNYTAPPPTPTTFFCKEHRCHISSMHRPADAVQDGSPSRSYGLGYTRLKEGIDIATSSRHTYHTDCYVLEFDGRNLFEAESLAKQLGFHIGSVKNGNSRAIELFPPTGMSPHLTSVRTKYNQYQASFPSCLDSYLGTCHTYLSGAPLCW